MSNILCLLGQIYIYILIVHVILSFVFAFKPDWRPPEWIRPLLNFIGTVVDPPVQFLRRFIPPLRSGAMAIDLGFLVWFLIVRFVLLPILCQIGGGF